MLREIAGLVVASSYMRGVYVQHGVPDQAIHVIPLPAAFAPDPTPPAVRTSRNRILFLGRLTSGKGGLKAIQVAARCQRALGRPLELTLAGDGPELARCKALAIKLGVATDFPGWVGAEQRMSLLRNADVLLVPSRWPEPFGMVGVEAASVGVPAVAYAAGGIIDWLRPGQSGELAEATGFRTRPLADALARALRDAEHYRALQLGAWQTSHRFGREKHLTELEAVFSSLSRGERRA